MRDVGFSNRGGQYGRGVSGILAALLLSTSGCALTEQGEKQGLRNHVGHATLDDEAETTVSLLLPAAGDVRDYGLVAGGTLDLRDRARTLNVAGAPLNLYNLGPVLGNSAQTTFGAWDSNTGAACGNVVSKGSVLLRDRARIAGDVITSGTIQKQNQVVIAGTQQTGAQIEEPLNLSWVQPLGSDSTKPTVNVWSGQSLTLDPGSYSQLAVYSTATLTLKSGSYAFSQFQLEPQSTLKLQVDPTKGPVVLYVDDVLAWRGATSPASAGDLMLVYTGTQPIKFEKKVTMAVVAPNSDITLSTGGLTHQGSIYARGIFLDPDVTFNYVPFKYWDWVLPPKPVANCVYSAGEGTYMAVFGYKNPQPQNVEIAASESNRFTPASSRNISPLTHFQPGTFNHVVWVDMPTTGITWSLNGQTASLDLSSPRCDIASLGVPSERFGDGRAYPPAGAVTPPGDTTLFTENGFGPGRYFTATSGSSETGVITQGLELDTGEPGEPPVLTLPESGPLPGPHYYRVDAHGFAEKEGIHENASFGLGATIGDRVYPVEFIDYSRHGNAEGSKSFTGSVVGSGPLIVKFVEYDNHSQDDTLIFEGLINDTAGTFSGERYAIINGDTHYIDPIVDAPVGSDTGIDGFGRDGKKFSLNFGVNKIQRTVPQGTVKLCAYWPTQYWDNGAEAITGREIPGTAVRGMPASFAKYFLTIVSAFEETHPTMPIEGELGGDPSQYKFLDKDGCIPEEDALRVAQLAYFPESPIDFFLKIVADYNIPAAQPGQYAQFVVYEAKDVEVQEETVNNLTLDIPIWPPLPASVSFHFRSFGGDLLPGDPSAWTTDSQGLLLPPSQVDVVGTRYDDTTNVAATVGRMLVQMQSLGVTAPADHYPVEVGAGSVPVGPPDYSCRRVGDTFFGGGATQYVASDPRNADRYPARMGIEIGGAFFPASAETSDCRACAKAEDCDQPQEDGACENNICRLRLSSISGDQERRLGCTAAEPECPGGQLCFAESVSESGQPGTPQLGCTTADSACFCGWSAQGGSKTSNAHELGHLMQKVLSGTGSVGLDYIFRCPANMSHDECSQFGEVLTSVNKKEGEPDTYTYYLNDPPGTSALCKCNQVDAANQRHCLQSIEPTSAAQIEGYGQFFAALVWNDESSPCNFNYYKEFLDPEEGAIPPPVPIDCGVRTAWRETHMCGADPNAPQPAGQVLNPGKMSTELDWMNFLTELRKSEGVGFNGIMNIYRHACHPENTPGANICLKEGDIDPTTGAPLAADQQPYGDSCYIPDLMCDDSIVFRTVLDDGVIGRKGRGGRPIFWRDALQTPPEPSTDPNVPTPAPPFPLDSFEEGGFYDGAVRIWGDGPLSPAQDVSFLGDAHAVSDGSEL